MQAVIVIIASYLLGSLIFSLVVGKLIGGVDVRKFGSGNAGATNTLRVLGLGPAIVVFALDLLKGIAAITLAMLVVPDTEWVKVVSGLAAIVGHNWPVWFRFRGGKGIATTIGVVIMLSFFAGLIAGIIGILSIVFTRYVSLGSLLFATLLPVMVAVLAYPNSVIWGSIAIALLAWYRHRKNVVKLVKGEENKLGSGKKVQHG